MTGEHGPPKPPVVASRDRVIEILTERFADDGLTLEEFERRLDLAHRATSEEALRALVPEDALPAPRSSSASPPSRRVSPVAVKERSLVLGFWGGSQRSGSWVPARKNYVVAFQGGAELDLRDARFGPGVTEIIVFCTMGGVNIIVSPDLQVDFGGVGIWGGFDIEDGANPVADPAAPVVKVRGFAFCGGAGVEIRHKGETAAEARQRRRLGKRMMRELRRPDDTGDPTIDE